MESEHSEECLARQHKDNVGYLAGHALAGILAHAGSTYAHLDFNETVELAAAYAEALAEALAKRLDNPPQDEV